jgi:signal transduction histidine kinase
LPELHRLKLFSPTIGSYLVALVMLAVIPLIVIAGVLTWRQSELQRQHFDRSLVQTAQALSVAVDRQLQIERVMLDTLAQSQFIDADNMEAFYAMCARIIKQDPHGVFISLFDGSGRQIFNTLRPMGEPLPTPFRDARVPDPRGPPTGDAGSLKGVLDTGMPVISDLFHGLVAGRLIFTVNVPVMRDGRIRYVLNAAFEPGVMTQLLHDNPQFSGVPAVILDRKGFIVGRSKDAEQFAGKLAAAHLVEHVAKSASGVASGTTLQGTPLYYSYARSPVTGWVASMGADRRELERAVRTGWIVGGALMVAGLVLGLLLALSIAARLRRAIVSLANAASRREPVKVGGLRTREIELLEHAVVEAAQAREARARREEAEAASATKDRYIATLSHELRNPLAALNNAVHLLGIEARPHPEFKGTLEMMQRQLAQLTRMVNDLLDVSRASHGKVTLELADVDLREVIAQAIETARGTIDRKRLRVTRELPPDPVIVRGDAARLLQVCSNLLDNACKFTAEGGGIAVALARDGNEALVTVSDTGVGIEASFLPRLFEAFTQADTSLERSSSGLGLGLALARQIVEAHRGRIDAASAGAGQGSRFSVRLPLP